MNTVDTDLPYVDEHAIRILAPPEVVWDALQRYVATSLEVAGDSLLAKLLGTDPPGGFEVADRAPTKRLTLSGQHRFSRYLLSFELADSGHGATQLRAQTYAVFPGFHGRIYRALVIGSRGHVVATNHILRSVRRLAARDPRAPRTSRP